MSLGDTATLLTSWRKGKKGTPGNKDHIIDKILVKASLKEERLFKKGEGAEKLDGQEKKGVGEKTSEAPFAKQII